MSEAIIRKGQEASLLLQALGPRFERHRKQAIRDLLAHFRGKTLTLDIAMAVAATLDVIERELADLSRDVDLGKKEMEDEYRQVP